MTGLRLSSSIAWEREHRTLEVLLVAPATWPSVAAAKFVSELSVFIFVALAYVVYLVAAQPMGAGVVGLAEAGHTLLTLLLAMPFLGLGLVVSTFSRTVRSASIVYIVLVLVFTAFDAAYGILVAIPPENLSLVALYGRATVELADPFIQFISPTSAVAAGAQVRGGGTGEVAGAIMQAIGLSFAMVALAVVAGSRRGKAR